jgi:hypothetical protein
MEQHEGELQVIEIDLDIMNKGELTESWLSMFGGAISAIMKRMFGGAAIPVKVRGNKDQIRDFARTIGREKKYVRSAAKYGLNDPRTYKNKFNLRQSVKKFERSTGLKWPFKN